MAIDPATGLPQSKLPLAYCAVCGRLALAADDNGTLCAEGHAVRVWEVRQEPAPPVAGESWRDRPALL